jgi:hypothetical protein
MTANKPGKPTPKNRRWYNQHYWSLLLALASFVVAYAIGSRSLDTGSWQQYGLTFVFGVFGLNRLGHAAHTTAKSLWSMLPKK